MSQLSDLPNKRSRIVVASRFPYTVGSTSQMYEFPHGTRDGSMDSLQFTWSQGNPPPYNSKDRDTGGAFYSRRFGYGRDVGGPFMRVQDIFPIIDRHTYRAGGRIKSPVLHVPHLLNDLYPRFHDSPGLVPGPSLEPFLFTWGTKAISFVKPTRSAASAYVALTELRRDGLPSLPGMSLWKERTRLAKAAGSEYLNTVFGWLPFINDVKQLLNVAQRHEAIWAQFERDAGRLVRREFAPDPDVNVSVDYPVYNFFGGPAYDDGVSARYDGAVRLPARRMTRTRTVTQKRWFRGAFRYYVPDRGSKSKLERYSRELQKLQKLLGILPTPDKIWSAAPWTWALDWVTDTSAVIGNVVDLYSQSLVMPYGYVMEHTIQTTEITSTGGWYIVTPGVFKPMPDMKFVVTDEVKQRLQASPYGFGLSWNGFTPQQLAILASLGITRGR